MTDDPYKDLAEHYDRMKFSSPDQSNCLKMNSNVLGRLLNDGNYC